MADHDKTGALRDAAGLLVKPEGWDRSIAIAPAASEEIALGDDCWRSNDYIRDNFDEHNTTAEVRHFELQLAEMKRPCAGSTDQFMPDSRQQRNGSARRRNHARRLLVVLLMGFLLGHLGSARSAEEIVSFSCALAIDAALAKLDEQSTNLVIKQALSTINDVNGQLVCIPMSADEIQVRLQSTDMAYADNRLVFSIDAKTYTVLKIFFGR
jgi:sulfur relay (sulfurtransferase) DsrC/TusE family protein